MHKKRCPATVHKTIQFVDYPACSIPNSPPISKEALMNLNKLLQQIDRVAGFDEGDAHCDIPCKIYDPSTAQISALTVLRMVDLIEETEKAADGS